jgi:broad specificity phosphatase PhoE
MKKLLPLLSIVVILVSSFWLLHKNTTYYIVRHAEKLNAESDTPLSPAGLARADILRDTLANVPLTRIFHSEKLRTRQTAAPTAAAKGITPEVYQTSDFVSFMQLAADIRGGKHLVVSHSNLVPDLVLHLSGIMASPIEENDFDNLYIVTRKSFAGWVYNKSVTLKRYGP